jgi:uncharacterized protein (DUF305 family)
MLSLSRLTAFALLGLGAAACNPRPDARGNASESGSDTMSSRMTQDTGMGGMSGMNNTSNPDQQFLRMMSDHHLGILLMAHDAEKKGIAVKAEAKKIDTAQDAELNKMVALLETDFDDKYAPKVTPENQAMAEALKQKAGAAYDTTFRENAIKHHQEALQMIDRFLPKLTRPDLKQMAEKMQADQTREIAKFKRELGQN